MPRRVASGSTRPAKARAPNVCDWERERGERPPPNLAPEPKGSGALLVFGHERTSAIAAHATDPARKHSRESLRAASAMPCLLFPGCTMIPFFAGASMNQNIRNIAIIAHVDHGKTTLVDKLLKEGGVYPRQPAGRGARHGLHGPRAGEGHHDQGQEHLRPLEGQDDQHRRHPRPRRFRRRGRARPQMVDGVLLLVDAYDGPQAQTRFVLRKALQHGLKVIIVINKIDRENSEPTEDVRQGPGTAAGAERQRGAVQRPGGLRQRPRRLHGAQARRQEQAT